MSSIKIYKAATSLFLFVKVDTSKKLIIMEKFKIEKGDNTVFVTSIKILNPVLKQKVEEYDTNTCCIHNDLNYITRKQQRIILYWPQIKKSSSIKYFILTCILKTVFYYLKFYNFINWDTGLLICNHKFICFNCFYFYFKLYILTPIWRNH